MQSQDESPPDLLIPSPHTQPGLPGLGPAVLLVSVPTS